MFKWQIRQNAELYMVNVIVKCKVEDHHLDDL